MFEVIYENINKNSEIEKVIEKVLKKCFEKENMLNSKLYITITLTNDQRIHEINKEFRNVDKKTDVLSFPMYEKEEIDTKIINKDFEFEDVLGDIIISIPTIEEQAKEYGHSFEREISYMVVHGFYHLMGYDHIVEDDKKIMREKENVILNELEILR